MYLVSDVFLFEVLFAMRPCFIARAYLLPASLLHFRLNALLVCPTLAQVLRWIRICNWCSETSLAELVKGILHHCTVYRDAQSWKLRDAWANIDCSGHCPNIKINLKILPNQSIVQVLILPGLSRCIGVGCIAGPQILLIFIWANL
jgi:hypothetical protein